MTLVPARRRVRRAGPAGLPLALALALATLAMIAGSALTGPAAEATPSLTDARRSATQLRAAVERLQVAAEQATEDYDAAQEQLGVAVQRYISAEEDLESARRRSSDQLDAAAARVRALYESGGSFGLYATVLDGGSITDVISGMRMADNVIADSRSQLAATGTAVAELAGLRGRLGRLAAERARLQQRAADKASAVRDLLGRQQAMLADADQRVRDLVAAQQQARLEAAARAFATRLEAARASAAASGLPLGAATTTDPVSAAAIAAARSRIGTPYVWGATGPGAFDCSGLTSWAYAQAGLRLPRTSREQWYAGPHPGLAELRPGDLLFWATDVTNPATIHHVALYIGSGQMIAAPHTGAVVTVQQVYLDGYIGAVRPVAG
ncbi:MAG: NlpC/P60 family protein [Frankiaceae bacterium]